MAHTISALRRHKQSLRRRQRNRTVKSTVRTQVRKVLEAVEKKDGEVSKKELSNVYQLLDRAVAKGVIHRNNADRHKARLAKRVNALAKA